MLALALAVTRNKHSEKRQFIRSASCWYLPHLMCLPCLEPWRGLSRRKGMMP